MPLAVLSTLGSTALYMTLPQLVHLPLGDFASSPSGRIYPLRSNRLPPPQVPTAPAVKEFPSLDMP